jgi:hypothetical protein
MDTNTHYVLYNPKKGELLNCYRGTIKCWWGNKWFKSNKRKIELYTFNDFVLEYFINVMRGKSVSLDAQIALGSLGIKYHFHFYEFVKNGCGWDDVWAVPCHSDYDEKNDRILPHFRFELGFKL